MYDSGFLLFENRQDDDFNPAYVFLNADGNNPAIFRMAGIKN